MFYEKMDGVPLKIELKHPQMGMTMEVVEIKKQSLPASDFWFQKITKRNNKKVPASRRFVKKRLVRTIIYFS